MKKTALHILLTIALTSCGHFNRPLPMVRTTTSHPGMMGVSPFTTTTDSPYESPSFHDNGLAMFSRR